MCFQEQLFKITLSYQITKYRFKVAFFEDMWIGGGFFFFIFNQAKDKSEICLNYFSFCFKKNHLENFTIFLNNLTLLLKHLFPEFK